MSETDTRGQIAVEEANLVAQIAAGDVGAPIAELYRRYGRLLYRFGVQMLGDKGLAEEMVQECFLKLWRTSGRFDENKASVATYLFVIARSVAADLRKRPSSRQQLGFDDTFLPPQPDDIDRLLDALVVHEAFNALSSAHAQVLRLAHHENLTQSEIAERLSLPLGTVKTRMFYGMQALRTALAERDFHAAL